MRGIPSDRPVEEITSQMNSFIAKRTKEYETRLTDITGYPNYSPVLMCNDCKKCFLQENVCLKSTSEPIFQCHPCLKKKIQLDLKNHNDFNDFCNSFPENLRKKSDSKEEDVSLEVKVLCTVTIVIGAILIFGAMGFIILPLIIIGVIFLFGFLVSNTNSGYPNLKQILTCHNGITGATMSAFQEVLHLNLDITMINSKGRINVFLFSAVLTFLEILSLCIAGFFIIPDFMTSLLVSNGLMGTILLYSIPASITLIAFFLGNMCLLELMVFLNYLNLYILDEEELRNK